MCFFSLNSHLDTGLQKFNIDHDALKSEYAA